MTPPINSIKKKKVKRNNSDVSVVSSRNTGQWAVLKFAAATTATAVACHLSPPGTVTNQIQAAFPELRLLVITDPRTDHQPLTEASCLTAYHCSVSHRLSSALCGHCHLWQQQGGSLRGSDVVMLAWKVLHMRGSISCEHPWEIPPDFYFYRDPEEIEKSRSLMKRLSLNKNFRVNGLHQPEFRAAQVNLRSQVWRPAGALCSYSAVSYWSLRHSACHWRLVGLQPPLLTPLNG